ncbi:unnamed protein product, partial [Candidula unifasciata]
EVPYVDDLLKTNRALPASFTFLDRRHKPHLLEVAEAQQRQTEALSRDKKGPVRMHPGPFDENSELAKGSRNHTSKMKSAQTSHSTLGSIQEGQTLASTQNKLNFKPDDTSSNGFPRAFIQNHIQEMKEEIQDLSSEICEDIE